MCLFICYNKHTYSYETNNKNNNIKRYYPKIVTGTYVDNYCMTMMPLKIPNKIWAIS